MSDHTSIEWTRGDDGTPGATWNPITGCTLVSAGCAHCYAAELATTRLRNHPSRAGLARKNAAGEAKFTGEVRFNEQWLDQPLRWKRPRRIFVCAHSDLFHENVPDEWIDRVFAVMALAPQHTFQCLTKRPERAREYLSGAGVCLRIAGEAKRLAPKSAGMWGLVNEIGWPLPNGWIGTSVEDQAAADARIPALLETPAAVHFLSVEPLLGPIDLHDYLVRAQNGFCPMLDWVIVGSESGRNARPCDVEWVRRLRDQCGGAGVAFFWKQHIIAGRKVGLPELDGRSWAEFPQITA